jgi:hypothetical protein
MIRQNAAILQPEDVVENHLEKVTAIPSETERFKLLGPYNEKMKVWGKDLLKNERVLTCGQCALVCGPSIDECANRYSMLSEGGFVVPGPNDEVTVVESYEEAVKMREKYLPKVPLTDTLKDFAISTVMWHAYYGGVEPKSVIGGFTYGRKLKQAVRDKIRGHLEASN